MFSGIVAGIGRVRDIRQTNRDLRIEIESGLDLTGVEFGASILHAGCCLTLIGKGDGWHAVEAVNETVTVSTAGLWRNGTPINLERSSRLGGALDGHIVTGHVDGIGAVVSLTLDGGSTRLRLHAPAPLHRLIARKGAITLNGVSLTVSAVEDRIFEVCIIPHTWEVTTLRFLEVGAPVNIEVDILARYLARWEETRPAT
jgi:riboflavin synthase